MLAHLILGGARSGKSRYALDLARGSGGPVAFVATAEARDGDMAARIARHRAERPARWTTIEEPLDLVGGCRKAAGKADLVLVDCLTLWIANRLLAGHADPEMLGGARELTDWLSEGRASVLLVSNEVGAGVVPPTADGGRFRDLLGQVNQMVAARADRVTFMVAGIPTLIKSEIASPQRHSEPRVSSILKRLDSIVEPDAEMGALAQRRLDQLTKPPGSLGRLEDLARDLCLMTGQCPPPVRHAVIFTLAGDHGVAAEGISMYPQVVTTQMVENFLNGGAAVNVLARQVGARVVVADLGIAGPPLVRPGLEQRRVASGTANLARGPALTRDQARAAIEAGATLVEEERGRGLDLIGTGEMGIGNTTAASAVTAAITGLDAEAVTGRGTGVDDATWRRKVDVVSRSLALNRPDSADGLDVLAKVGGLEIAGLAGVILAGAAHRIPILLDGFIAGVAALAAVALKPETRHYLIAAHRSVEPGHDHVLAALRLTPYLDLGMRLGEGTGAALGIGLARAAAAILAEMATFKSAGVSERA